VTLTDRLTDRLTAGTLGNLADLADDLGLAFDADQLGRVTVLTDGVEAARVVTTEDGIELAGFESCPVPDWADRDHGR
jgi:hypothetical protein